jgi:Flp pilus assembly pilin Flp
MKKQTSFDRLMVWDSAARVVKGLWQEEEGQDLVEYGLLLFLVALSAIASMQSVASAISSVFNSAATSLTSSAS